MLRFALFFVEVHRLLQQFLLTIDGMCPNGSRSYLQLSNPQMHLSMIRKTVLIHLRSLLKPNANLSYPRLP